MSEKKNRATWVISQIIKGIVHAENALPIDQLVTINAYAKISRIISNALIF
jgi:hypothetical protein